MERYTAIYLVMILTFSFITLSNGGSIEEKEQLLSQKNEFNKALVETDKVEKKEAMVSGSDTAANMPYISEVKALECKKETIKGLKAVGYTVGDIVRNLVRSGNKAQDISMALLSTGDYSGQVIYNALIKNGNFSVKEAEAAVPAGIRNEGQLFGPIVKQNDKEKAERVAEKVIIKRNPLRSFAMNSYEENKTFEDAILRAIDVNSVKPQTAQQVTVKSADGENQPVSSKRVQEEIHR